MNAIVKLLCTSISRLAMVACSGGASDNAAETETETESAIAK